MGKKSLLKSTTKKKSASKKKSSAKNKEKKGAAKKTKAPAKGMKTTKAKPKKSAPKKAAPKTGSAAKAKTKKTAVKAGTKKKAPAKKTAKVKKKKPPTRKELIFQKFEPWKPDTLFVTPVDAEADGEITSPPFFSAETPGDEKRIRELLFQKIDLSAPPKPAPKKAKAPKPAAPKKKPPTRKELIFERFDPWKPDTLFVPSIGAERDEEISSPPFFSAETPGEEKRIRELLFQKIDLSAPPKPAPKKAKAPKPAAPKKKKPPTRKELIFEKFETWKPDALFVTPVDAEPDEEITSPPFFYAETPGDEKRIRELLFQKIDLSAPPKPAPQKAKAPKSAAPKKKPPTRKELIFEKFDPWKPDTLFVTPVDAEPDEEISSPPFFSAETPGDEKRIRELLFQKIDLSAPPKPAPKKAKAPEPAAPKKKPPTRKELIFQKFEPWKPDALFAPPADAKADEEVASPPFFSADTPEEEKRIKELLFQKIDLKIPPKAAPEKEPAAKAVETAPEPTKEEVEAPETEKTQSPAPEPEPAVVEKPAASGEDAEKEELKEMQETAKKVVAAKKPEEETAAPTPPEEEKTPPPKEPTDFGGPGEPGGPDPTNKLIKYVAAGFVFLIVLIMAGSYSNSCRFFLVEKEGGLEIWQGSFSPMGKTLLETLPGVKAPEPVKDVYSKDEVHPILFQFYLDKADELVDKEGWPDFDGIKANVDKALPYATTPKAHADAKLRINNLRRFMFIYKANISISKNTEAGYEAAVAYLEKAAFIASTDEEAAALKKKLESVKKSLANLRAEEKAKAQKAREAAETEKARKIEEQKKAEQEAYLKRMKEIEEGGEGDEDEEKGTGD